MSSILRVSLLTLCMAGMLSSAGCGKGKRALYPAKGQLVDSAGKPATGATIVLHPVKAANDDTSHKPAAVVDSDGSFVLTTYIEKDGAPAGEYVATIEWRPLRKSLFDPDPADKLNGKYNEVGKSPFKVTIEPKSNDLPPIKLP